MSGTTTTAANTTGRTTGPSLRFDLVGVGAATICALILWATATLSGVDLTVRTGEALQHVGGVAVGIFAALGAAVGFATLRVMERLLRRPLQWWTVLVAAVVVLSIPVGPLGATSLPAVGTLIALHVLVAAVVVAVAWRSRRGKNRTRAV